MSNSFQNAGGTLLASSGPAWRFDDATIDGAAAGYPGGEVRRPANCAVAALVFGQAVGQDAFSVGVGVAGIATWAVFMVIAFALSGESR